MGGNGVTNGGIYPSAGSHHTTHTMLRNYLRTAFRVITRHSGHAFLNLAGLTAGVGVALLLLLFIQQETSFDQFHEASDRIHRAWVLEDYGDDQQFFNTTTPLPLATTLADGIPEIEATVRYDRITDRVSHGDVRFNESLFVVDRAFFDVFDFPVVQGNPESPFDGANSVAISQSAAQRYFGESNPIGQELVLERGGDPWVMTVSAVLENPPITSSLQFDFLLPFDVSSWLYSERAFTAWFNVSPETYVLLREGSSLASVEAKIPAVMAAALGNRVEPGQYNVGLQPLESIHLDTSFPIGYAPVSNPVYLRVLVGVALLILLIACINFVTLNLSRAPARSREIGVRKAIGASRRQLISQHMGEAFVFSVLAIGIGVLIARLLVPAFNNLSGSELIFAPGLSTWLMIAGLLAGITLFIGLYPALVMSSYEPTQAFRGQAREGRRSGWLRKGLVTVQFTLSVVMVAAMLVMGRQLDFVTQSDLGFDADQVLYLPVQTSPNDAFELADRLRFATSSRSDIASVSATMFLFDPDGWMRIGFDANDGTYRRFYTNLIEPEFLETMGLTLTQGRGFNRDNPGEANRALIVNEALVEAYGWTDPLNEQLPGSFDEHEIIGVVKDFHYASLHTSIEPAILTMSARLIMSGASDNDYQGAMQNRIAVRVSGQDVRGTIGYLESIWPDVAGDLPFAYRFVDQDLQAQYEQESRLARITRAGGLFALGIAALGLFGLAAVSVARRTREIGIRKAIGASTSDILLLFGREFSPLVLTAVVLALPLGWWGLSAWLDSFAYQTALTVWPFALAGVAALGIMAVAVGAQSMKAALSDPVKALKDPA